MASMAVAAFIASMWNVPVWALLFNAFWLFIIGCVYLASSSGKSLFIRSFRVPRSFSEAFNVFIGTTMLTEFISSTFPAALLMWRRRDPKYLPKKSPFNLGYGWLVNTLVVGWTVFAFQLSDYTASDTWIDE